MRKTTHHRSGIDSYQLIDFGQGRKLESFGGRLFNRPSPAAEGEPRRSPELWRDADSFFDAGKRQWTHHTPLQSAIEVVFDRFRMPISPTPFGHLGVFPEQAPNWRWLRTTAPDPALVGPQSTTTDAIVRDDAVPQKGLNLFGYTGASSIAMAVSGLAVAHVDAAKQNVSSARSAARINGLAEHPIRYLVDDAVKFVAREVRRGNRYHTIVMDPPAYGHSPSGKAWRLERDLWSREYERVVRFIPGGVIALQVLQSAEPRSHQHRLCDSRPAAGLAVHHDRRAAVGGQFIEPVCYFLVRDVNGPGNVTGCVFIS